MRTRISDVVMGVGAVLTAVALVLMLVDLAADEAPGDWLIAMLTLGIVCAVGDMVRRFEQDAAQQPNPAEVLREARRQRANTILHEQIGASARARPTAQDLTKRY